MARLEAFGNSLKQSLRIMSRNKVGFLGFIMTTLIILISFLAPLFLKVDLKPDMSAIYLGPSAEHWLGTDYQGRDVFAQLLLGGRDVIIVAALTAFLTVLIGITLGSLAALVGGWVDTIFNSAAELVITIPTFPLLMVLAGFIKLTSPFALALILAGVGWGTLMRTIRAQVLSLRERDYVQAARALGLPTLHLLFKEILPNMMSFVVVQFVMAMTGAIYSQVGLIFLGVVPMATNNWGVMINLAWGLGAIFGPTSRWYLLAPVFMIALLQFSLISMSRSLDELFNPRLRTGE